MDLNQVSSFRKISGKACALFFLLASLAVLDGITAKFREPVNVFHVLPGEEAEVNGPIPEHIKAPEALTFASDSPDLTVFFDAIHSGYFLGGNMWRGRLAAGGNLAPGKYAVTVRPKDYPKEKPGYDLRVVVYPDPLSQRAAFKSLIKSRTGTSPYLVAAAFLPFIGISLGLVYLLSRRIEVLQAEKGLAEIYHVARDEGQYRVAFGLGTGHGVNPGDQVTVLDPAGNYVGVARVQESSAQDSVGLIATDQDIRPGYLVSRN
ncbi:MAG: hypothetical protein WAU47_14675 [Desulfobaccales bacterium]